jgi:hypothetical protein
MQRGITGSIGLAKTGPSASLTRRDGVIMGIA